MSIKTVSFVVASFATLAATCLAADVEWLDAVDGAWGVGANWIGGAVPNSARAVIANESSGFTVSVAETSNPKIAGLLLQNGDGTFTNTVRVTGLLSSQDDDLSINGGGLLHIDGGTLAITNSSDKSIIVSGSTAMKAGGMKVSGGLLDFRMSSAKQNGGICLKGYSQFEATGGKIRLTAPREYNTGNWGLYCDGPANSTFGGTVEVEIANRCIDLRRGSHVIKNSARVFCSEAYGSTFFLRANSTGSGVALTISDGAELDLSNLSNGYMGDHSWASENYRSAMKVEGGTVKLPTSFVVGRANGSSEMDISGGVTTLDFYGFDIGSYNQSKLSSTTQNPSGTVNVSGGALVVSSASGGQSTTFKSHIWGLVVGNGSEIETYHSTPGYSCTGALNVSGGAVTNGVGLFVVGSGRAIGRVLQTGGDIYHGLGFTTDAWRKRTPMVVGFAGGSGTYVISNGVTEVRTPIYIGGVETNVFSRPPIINWPGDGFTDRSAVGKLVAAGGKLVTRSTDLVVGADGSGTLEIGPSGTVSIGESNNGSGNIVLSNRTESVTRFVLGSDGVGSLTTPNKLIVANGAKLEVDVSAYTGDSKWLKLIGCGTREGSFADADISVVGQCERGSCKVVQSRDGDSTGSVWLHLHRGLLISFR